MPSGEGGGAGGFIVAIIPDQDMCCVWYVWREDGNLRPWRSHATTINI